MSHDICILGYVYTCIIACMCVGVRIAEWYNLVYYSHYGIMVPIAVSGDNLNLFIYCSDSTNGSSSSIKSIHFLHHYHFILPLVQSHSKTNSQIDHLPVTEYFPITHFPQCQVFVAFYPLYKCLLCHEMQAPSLCSVTTLWWALKLLLYCWGPVQYSGHWPYRWGCCGRRGFRLYGFRDGNTGTKHPLFRHEPVVIANYR